MKNDSIMIRECEQGEIEELARFAYRINGMQEHSSAFCSRSLEAIHRDFEQGIASESAFLCRRDGQLMGVLSGYIDYDKNNTDCSLLIEPQEVYVDIAAKLFDALQRGLSPSMKYTFFFPKENTRCSAFLDQAGARREVNEYALVLHRGREKLAVSSFSIKELLPEYYGQFVKLHDSIFPGIYISGREIIDDIGKGHIVYGMLDETGMTAYSVLRLNGEKRVTAEIVGVREDCRHKGYGRAILSHLIEEAFKKHGTDRVDLIVDGDNENAISLYLQLGFVVEGENCCYVLQRD